MKYRNLPKIKINKEGFVILFAVTLSAILLSIALGVANIALKEVKFGTSARDTNDAFFAADTGAECALYYSRSDKDEFPLDGLGGGGVECSTLGVSFDSTDKVYTFKVTGLGNSGQGCAIVKVDLSDSSKTTIISKGYNLGNASSCPSSSSNLIEREIRVSYENV